MISGNVIFAKSEHSEEDYGTIEMQQLECSDMDQGECAAGVVEEAWNYSDPIYAKSVIHKGTARRNLASARKLERDGESPTWLADAEALDLEAKTAWDDIHKSRRRIATIHLCNLFLIHEQKIGPDYCEDVRSALEKILKEHAEYEEMEQNFVKRYPVFQKEIDKQYQQTLDGVQQKREQDAAKIDPAKKVTQEQCEDAIPQGSGSPPVSPNYEPDPLDQR